MSEETRKTIESAFRELEEVVRKAAMQFYERTGLWPDDIDIRYVDIVPHGRVLTGVRIEKVSL